LSPSGPGVLTRRCENWGCPTIRTSLGAIAAASVASAVLIAAKPSPQATIVWSGATWTIKTSAGLVGPGPNRFDRANVSVDAFGNLHLRIAKNAANQWTCAEIIAPESHGYGTYTFAIGSRVDALDPNVVLGLFTWSDRPQYAHREIDIEFARWGNPSDPTNAQYVVQPYDRPAHLMRFFQPPTAVSTHRFTWQPGQVTWESYDESGRLIDDYAYAGTDVPKPGDERVRLNLWLFRGAPPTDSNAVDVTVASFTYTP
jgi:hypothetical protein